MNIPSSLFEAPLFLATAALKYTFPSTRPSKPHIDTADPYLELIQNVIFPADLPLRRCIQLTAVHKGAGVTRTCHAMAETLEKTLGKSVLVISAEDLLHLSTSKSDNLLPGVESREVSLPTTRGVPFKASETICFLPPTADADPAALLHKTVEKLLDRFDFVIVDAPALDSSSVPIIVARAVAGTILVVESGRSRKKHLIQATARLEAAHTSLLGFVLNKRSYPIPSWIFRWL